MAYRIFKVVGVLMLLSGQAPFVWSDFNKAINSVIGIFPLGFLIFLFHCVKLLLDPILFGSYTYYLITRCGVFTLVSIATLSLRLAELSAIACCVFAVVQRGKIRALQRLTQKTFDAGVVPGSDYRLWTTLAAGSALVVVKFVVDLGLNSFFAVRCAADLPLWYCRLDGVTYFVPYLITVVQAANFSLITFALGARFARVAADLPERPTLGALRASYVRYCQLARRARLLNETYAYFLFTLSSLLILQFASGAYAVALAITVHSTVFGGRLIFYTVFSNVALPLAAFAYYMISAVICNEKTRSVMEKLIDWDCTATDEMNRLICGAIVTFIIVWIQFAMVDVNKDNVTVYPGGNYTCNLT